MRVLIIGGEYHHIHSRALIQSGGVFVGMVSGFGVSADVLSDMSFDLPPLKFPVFIPESVSVGFECRYKNLYKSTKAQRRKGKKGRW